MRAKKAQAGEKIAVIGLGNILLQDEGAGVHVIETLRKDFDFPKNIQLIDGGTIGLNLLSFIEGMDKILIIDAVNIKKEPGTIVIIDDEDIPSFVSAKLSVHEIAFPDVFSVLKSLGIKPARMTLVGIQPESVDIGLNMSEAVNKKFDRLVNTVIERLNQWGVEVIYSHVSRNSIKSSRNKRRCSNH
ncbi:MAG: HyaD/HybD family hydrogenase maturation endopeptidase [Deltaproteobacteria bacterium]|nr:HyaD/HybD family hydrogenase maturation endopeptidase [Deltaproteobacteria bacterium]